MVFPDPKLFECLHSMDALGYLMLSSLPRDFCNSAVRWNNVHSHPSLMNITALVAVGNIFLDVRFPSALIIFRSFLVFPVLIANKQAKEVNVCVTSEWAQVVGFLATSSKNTVSLIIVESLRLSKCPIPTT